MFRLAFISLWMSVLPFFGKEAGENTPPPVKLSYTFDKGSKVTINGTTNVKDFACVSKRLFGSQSVMITHDQANNTIHFQNAVLNVNIESLNCGNTGINKDMMHAMKAERYPTIGVTLVDAVFAPGSSFNLSKETPMKLDVYISMAGQTHKAVIPITGLQTAANQYRFNGKYDLLMSDYGVQPPTALFGMIKVKDGIKVNFDLIITTHVVNQ